VLAVPASRLRRRTLLTIGFSFAGVRHCDRREQVRGPGKFNPAHRTPRCLSYAHLAKASAFSTKFAPSWVLVGKSALACSWRVRSIPAVHRAPENAFALGPLIPASLKLRAKEVCVSDCVRICTCVGAAALLCAGAKAATVKAQM
jgi:hypothetical protein